MKLVRRLSIALACTFVFFALIAGYRAIVQIYDIELRSPPSLRGGETVALSITASGRNGVTATIILVQGARAETLGVHKVRDNHIGWFISQSINPFPVKDSMSVIVPAIVLASFSPGPATLRAVGLGKSQWLRVPPPTIRERPVVIAR